MKQHYINHRRDNNCVGLKLLLIVQLISVHFLNDMKLYFHAKGYTIQFRWQLKLGYFPLHTERESNRLKGSEDISTSFVSELSRFNCIKFDDTPIKIDRVGGARSPKRAAINYDRLTDSIQEIYTVNERSRNRDDRVMYSLRELARRRRDVSNNGPRSYDVNGPATSPNEKDKSILGLTESCWVHSSFGASRFLFRRRQIELTSHLSQQLFVSSVSL